ncbi:MAG TPA: ABC transporter permease [Polyangiaceae bacterium LLY-WYZ-15_(1-7)]|nr:ABC transporter permease [Myxococcales bacterium]MAT23518.1 ABC transporter permease [Sandaracinus sp.]HJK95105.1 ABC transporter permease [Polyangiaceae bacterium LLY-WYZ-15_(1-7)]MBJ73780.1 ABC transporter permease [Sandaracinus sp.]HJL02620.1 ABC transporter permease [Polyangiaceae bacterium LLY-WYZ-15_(1-7)]
MAFTARAENVSPLAALKNVLQDALAVARVGRRTMHYLIRGKREPGSVARQMFAIGNQSLFFMCITMAFIGAIITFQTGLQSKKLVPDFSMIGATYLKLLIRDLAASVGALPLATRVGAGIAAEIGSMVVTEQVDALRMCAADPVDYLVVPRFIASVIMGTVILIIGGFVAYGSGMLVAQLMFDVSPHTFTNLSLVTMGDLVLGVSKAVTYGGAIALVSGQRGLATFGGSEGVGWATTEAVVGSCFAIIVLNLVISTIGYFFVPAL